MPWQNSLPTHIWIFSVGRGNAAFIRSGLNQGFIIDMGCADNFSPASFIERIFVQKLDPYKSHKIAQAILSHPHSDHISACSALSDQSSLHPELLTCPHDKVILGQSEKINWERIKNMEGSDNIIAAYKSLYASRNPPLQTIRYEAPRTIPNLEYGIYYLRPPICESLHESDDNKYANSTSIMFYLRHGSHSILFPGDMTAEGMKHILDNVDGTEMRYTVFSSTTSASHPRWHECTCDQPLLKSKLRDMGLSILVAPHHGLTSSYSPDLYSNLRGGKPDMVVISEKRHRTATDGCIDPRYQCSDGARGLPITIDGTVNNDRKSISTINGHHILIVFSGTGRPKIFAERDPELLLQYLE